MNALLFPRRVVFAADPVTHSWVVGRSSGWPNEAAAEEAVWRLDTDGATLEIPDFAGFFALGPSGWVVVRGCLAPAPNHTGRYLREAIALSDGDLARLRWDPFRILPDPGRFGAEPPPESVEPPALPAAVSAADDLERVRELSRIRADARAADELEMLLAAALDVEHTLITGIRCSYDELELLLLLLPPQARTRLTFHSCATASPMDPVPRLVFTAFDDASRFEPPSAWGHHLPRTRAAIGGRARRAAAGLLSLLATPERLVEAQEAREAERGGARASAPVPLEEAERLLHIVHGASAPTPNDSGEALRRLAEAASEAAPRLERDGAAEAVYRRVPPDRIGAALAQHLRKPRPSLQQPALVMERFFARRQQHAAEFEAFSAPLEDVLRDVALPLDDENARRIRTLLLLHAAARGDAGGVADALVLPLPRDVIARVGGLAAWLPRQTNAIAQAIRALAAPTTTEAASDGLRALASLAGEVAPVARRIPLAEAGVELMRRAFRRLPAARWQAGLPLAAAGAELAGVALHPPEIRVSHGAAPAADAGVLRPQRAEDGKPSDAEVFFGFLGIRGSPHRPQPSEIGVRGEALVREVAQRIRARAEPGRAADEAVHWSIALLDRVRRGETEPEFIALAARLLETLAAGTAGTALRVYLEVHPEARSWWIEHASLRDLLDTRSRNGLAAAALEEVLTAGRPGDPLKALERLCRRLGDAGVRLGADELRRIDRRARDVLPPLPRGAPDRDLAARRQALLGALAPVAESGALSALQEPVVPAIGGPDAEPATAAVHVQASSVVEAIEVEGGAQAAHGSPAQAGVPAVHEVPETGPRADRPAPAEGARPRLPWRPAWLRVPAVSSLRLPKPRLPGKAGRMRLQDVAAALGGVLVPLALWFTGVIPQALEGSRGDADLDQARRHIASGEWAEAVSVLSAAVPDRAAEALARDSLLAGAALRRAAALPPSDAQRPALLALSYESSSRALAVLPFGPGADELRLLRAEACIAGHAGCQHFDLVQDLVFAARSSLPAVRRRAMEMLSAVRQ